MRKWVGTTAALSAGKMAVLMERPKAGWMVDPWVATMVALSVVTTAEWWVEQKVEMMAAYLVEQMVG